MPETFTTPDIFNLNLKTLESMHETVEKIGDIDKLLGIGVDQNNKPVHWGNLLYAKYRLIKHLLRWCNVLISDRSKFNKFKENYGKIIVKAEKEKIADQFSMNKNPSAVWVYDKEVEEKLDNLVFDMCSALQDTGIFKMKANDPRTVAGRS